MTGRTKLNRRDMLKLGTVPAAAILGRRLLAADAKTDPAKSDSAKADARPNILFCIADDWSWPHASIAGDPVVKTPTFDGLCRDGVMFTNAYVAAPSCSPSRSAVLTGQDPWRLEEGGILWGTLPRKFTVYPDLLEAAGYFVGYTRKGWGPGRDQPGGRTRNPAGPRFKDFAQFLKQRPKDKPFCFWFGSFDPHRGYVLGSGVTSGMDPTKVRVPPCLADSPEVRGDICDYYFEVQRYDSDVRDLIRLVRAAGELELDNTLIVMTSDNGLPFPRCKCNLYDTGTHMPLAVRWSAKVKPGRTVTDFVGFIDFAPTFLAAAGLKPPAEMTGRSFLDVLLSDKAGRVDPKRDRAFTGVERHVGTGRPGNVGYPCRAVRTDDFLYIRNFHPDRWPAGDPPRYADIDGGPTKDYMFEHRQDPKAAEPFKLAFEKRPAEELYDLKKDPDQLHNVADAPEYAAAKAKLAAAVTQRMNDIQDARFLGKGDQWNGYPYYGGGGGGIGGAKNKKKPQPKAPGSP